MDRRLTTGGERLAGGRAVLDAARRRARGRTSPPRRATPRRRRTSSSRTASRRWNRCSSSATPSSPALAKTHPGADGRAPSVTPQPLADGRRRGAAARQGRGGRRRRPPANVASVPASDARRPSLARAMRRAAAGQRGGLMSLPLPVATRLEWPVGRSGLSIGTASPMHALALYAHPLRVSMGLGRLCLP